MNKIFPHPQLSKMEIPLQTRAAQNTEVPFPLVPSQKAIVPEGGLSLEEIGDRGTIVKGYKAVVIFF